MVGGFNTNVRHRGRIFHVQTEDSGKDNPQIITLLYEGGAILTSRKTSYADRLGSGDLDRAVRDLMEEQHREVVAELKRGGFDELLDGGRSEAPPDGVTAEIEPRTHGAQSFGEGTLSGRPLDEVILAHLGGA